MKLLNSYFIKDFFALKYREASRHRFGHLLFVHADFQGF